MAKTRILLVDDDDIFREAIEKTLVSEGYHVVTAINGKRALATLSALKFDLVISDIRMPEMDGVELLKNIRSNGSLPVILITGFSEIMETKTAYELGANEFLAKPFKKEELTGAIAKSLGRDPRTPSADTISNNGADYCRLGINDFITGRTIKFNIFVRLLENKFVKIAHKGEDITPERIRYYREKGLTFLYLRREDFRNYVGFSLEISERVNQSQDFDPQRKLMLLRHTGEILNEQIRHEGVDGKAFDSATAFVEATLDVLTDDMSAVALLEALNRHADYLLVHSVGVSFYAVLIAQALKWDLPTNKFKVAMGGLLHDVGMKEISGDILKRPRYSWNAGEVKSFEEHPLRGTGILGDLKAIPQDVRDIVKQHHENCLSLGYPARVKKMQIHPMAKVISVADEFCYRAIKNPLSAGLQPPDALQDMMIHCADLLDKQALEALVQTFRGASA